jgi:hypothetical protein
VKDEAARPQSEMDVLKFYIWLMVVMTVAIAGFSWYVWNDVEAKRKNLQQGTAWMKELSQQGSEIQAMLTVHKNNKEDIARDSPSTWFSNIWRRRGINDASIVPGPWKIPPTFNAKGKYYEEQIELKFNAKAPLSRQSILEFCYWVEKSSTRQRILVLDVRRSDKENFDKDEWAGGVTIGYRHARAD